MKFPLSKHQATGQARELDVRLNSVTFNYEENLLNAAGEVIFAGKTDSVQLGSQYPINTGEGDADQTADVKAAKEEFNGKVLKAFSEYYLKIDKNAK